MVSTIFSVPKPSPPPAPVQSQGLHFDTVDPLEMMSRIVMGPTPEQTQKKSRFAVGGAQRPDDIYYRMTRQNNWWAPYLDVYKMFQENSLAFTLALRSAVELTRFDIIAKPRFAKKCDRCGYTSQTMIDECPECHADYTHLRRPDERKKETLRKSNGKTWIEEANNNKQPLKELIKSFAFTEYQLNQAYLVCSTRVTYDEENGEKILNIPVEFLTIDPIRVQQLFDDTGEFGTVYGFTMDARDKMLNLAGTNDNDIENILNLNDEGKQIYAASYKVGSNLGASGQYRLYTNEEVYQAHWFKPAMTYGIPIWFSIWDDLRAWNALEKHFFKKYNYGFTRKLIFIPGVQDEDIDEVTKGVTDVLAKNDNSLPIICTPPTMGQTAEIRPYALDLGTENSQDALAVKDDIRNRVCAFVGVPNLFAGDVEQSGGMNNESQQIVVFERFLTEKLAYIDDLLSWFSSWFPAFNEDWVLVMDRPSRTEVDARKRIDKMQEAKMMKELGYLQEYYDGEFHYSRRPFDQQQMLEQYEMQKKQMQQQMQMQQMMAMQQQQGTDEEAFPEEDRGILPGDGDGPPEKGSARRENPEIDGAKDEIDQVKRETKL